MPSTPQWIKLQIYCPNQVLILQKKFSSELHEDKNKQQQKRLQPYYESSNKVCEVMSVVTG